MESNTDNTTDEKTRLHNEEVLKKLKPGDLIKINRNLYTHWAVYIGQEEGVEKVIHWWTGDETVPRRTLTKAVVAFIKIDKLPTIADSGDDHIRIDAFWTVVRNSKAENGNDKYREDGNIDGSRVVQGAMAFKDEIEHRKTSCQFYDGEHFAKWCRYGLPIQVKSLEQIASVTDLSTLMLDPTYVNIKKDEEIGQYNRELLDTLKKGDLVKFDRGFYYHWAVYIGKDEETDDADPKVIHWWGPPEFKTLKKGTSIMKTSFWEAARKSKAKNGNDNDREKGNINGHRVAARAEAKQSLVQDEILQEKYNILFNNCEHFAKWCRYGLDDAKLAQESISDHQTVVIEIEVPTTVTHVSELSGIYAKCASYRKSVIV